MSSRFSTLTLAKLSNFMRSLLGSADAAAARTALGVSAGSGGSIGDTVTSGTAGSVLFVATGPVLAQDNANFYWDDSNNRLGIGHTTPLAPVSIGTTANGNKVFIYDDGAGNKRGLGVGTGTMELYAPTTQIGSGSSGSFTVYGSFTSTGLFIGSAASSTDAQLQVHSGATNRPALQIRGADTHVTDVMLVREKVGANEWTRQKIDVNFDWINQTRSGAQNLFGTLSEEKTLSTSGATSDTTIQLPANSIILGVTARVTTTISGVDSTTLQVGDATTAARFGSGSTLTAGATIVGLSHMQGGITTDATGPVQTSAAAVRLTLTGGADNTPSAGAVRVTIHYIQLVAATS